MRASRAGRRSPASGSPAASNGPGGRPSDLLRDALVNQEPGQTTRAPIVLAQAMASSLPEPPAMLADTRASTTTASQSRSGEVLAGHEEGRGPHDRQGEARRPPQADPARPAQAVDPDARQARHRQRDPQVIPHRDPRAADDRHAVHEVEQASITPEHEQHAHPAEDHPGPHPAVAAGPRADRRPGPCRSGRGRRSSRGMGSSRRSSRCRGRACRRPRGGPGSAGARATTTRR